MEALARLPHPKPPHLLPGLLLALHYVAQVSRPRMGHGSDLGQRRTPWIVGGMVTLAAGGWLPALATVWMGTRPVAGVPLALLAYVLIGLGVAAAGTSLLVLLAKRVAAERRAAAATTVWIMMIAGFVVAAASMLRGSLLISQCLRRRHARCAPRRIQRRQQAEHLGMPGAEGIHRRRHDFQHAHRLVFMAQRYDEHRA